jgi:DNA polymerase theta
MAVCTIEKANMAINRMVLEGRLHELVFVVVDEAHMITDPERGLALEVREVLDVRC